VGSPGQATNVQTLNTVIADASPQAVANANATANYTVFDFATVLGPSFNAQNLPILNDFFNKVTINTVDASQDVKAFFNSPGPQTPATYPSTQTMMGLDEGVLLGLMVPEMQSQLQSFGIQEGLNRLIVDAHWPTDVSGGYMLSDILMQDMSASPQFQSDFNAAKTELRSVLGLK
jgi:acid phosphatase (class A)